MYKSMGMQRRMLTMTCPLCDDIIDSTLQYNWGLIWPYGQTKPRSMANQNMRRKNQELKCDFELPFLCFTSYKTWRNFLSLSARELEVRAIGQSLWLHAYHVF